jgi:chromosome segregation protein
MAMLIKRIEIQGFKSFGDRTKIVFHPGITAIVGPNGTGKSNIIDSTLWALGGQRNKALRGDNIGDIIFNGNAKRPPLGMADVTLVLGDTDKDEELVINHRVYRSGESEYRLNGKAARLKDIQDALWKRDVAEKEYYVIEQGAIGLFVTSKPQEKRALLEEAAGTAFYKDKRKQAESKLETSEQNLVRLEDIVAEVEKAKNSLQRQASAANRYRKLREKIRELTGYHFQRRIRQVEKSLEEATARFNESLHREKELTGLIQALEKDLAAARKDQWDLEQALKSRQDQIFGLKSQAAKTEADREKEARRIEFFEEEKRKAAAGREEFSAEIAALDKETEAAGSAVEELVRALAAKDAEVQRTGSESEGAKVRLPVLEAEIESLRAAHVQRLSSLTESRNELLRLDKEWEFLLRQEEKHRGQIASQREILARQEEKLGGDEAARGALRRGLEEREARLAALKAEAAERESKIEALAAETAARAAAREEASIRLQALRTLEAKERETNDAPPLPGSPGILADLVEAGDADAPLIDVLWKEEARARVVPPADLLAALAGAPVKGSFLLLPAASIPSAPPPIDEPEVLGFLKSRVRPGAAAPGALDRLPDAVIVADLATAVRLWERHPDLSFATPQGDVVCASGLVKAGQRGEGLLTLAREIRSAEEKVASLDLALRPLESARLELAAAAEEAAREAERTTALRIEDELRLAEADKEIEFGRADRDKIAGAVEILVKELAAQIQEKGDLNRRRECLRQRVVAAELAEREDKDRLAEAERERSGLQEAVSRTWQAALELKAGRDLIEERLQNGRRQVRDLGQRREAARARVRALEDEIRSCDDEQGRVRFRIDELARRIKALEDERGLREQELGGEEERLRGLRDGIEEKERRLAKAREDLEVLKEERVRWEVGKAETERDRINLEESCWQELKKTLMEVKLEPPAEEGLDDAEIERLLEEAREDLGRFKAVNLMAEEEYHAQKERFDFLTQQRNDLRQSIDATQEAIRKIDEESRSQFLAALEAVNKNFQDIFAILFKGGTAAVRLSEPETPLESGVEIVAQPPGKKVQNLALLSGGEKTLTSLAFLFALFRYKPTPFCILDEIDAALDEANLVRFLELMKQIKKETQFIIVTHNFKTMEVADFIYGTTMVEPNITSVYSVKLGKKGADGVEGPVLNGMAPNGAAAPPGKDAP